MTQEFISGACDNWTGGMEWKVRREAQDEGDLCVPMADSC